MAIHGCDLGKWPLLFKNALWSGFVVCFTILSPLDPSIDLTVVFH